MRALTLVSYQVDEREAERSAFLNDLESRIVDKEGKVYAVCIKYLPSYGNQEPASRMSFYWLLQGYLETMLAGLDIETASIPQLSPIDLRDKLRGIGFVLIADIVAPAVRL